MELNSFLTDKGIKPKEKTEILAAMIAEKEIMVAQLAGFAKMAKEPVKATCMEALEHATLANPAILDEASFDFVVQSLKDKGPRVKWESARVIANTAHLFKGRLGPAVENLLANTEHPGTVVRWSAAFALGGILKLNTSLNNELVPAIRAIVEREKKESIRKLYLQAMRKVTSDE